MGPSIGLPSTSLNFAVARRSPSRSSQAERLVSKLKRGSSPCKLSGGSVAGGAALTPPCQDSLHPQQTTSLAAKQQPHRGAICPSEPLRPSRTPPTTPDRALSRAL